LLQRTISYVTILLRLKTNIDGEFKMVQSNFTNPFAEMFKMFGENNMMGKMPGFDMSQMMNMQRRNAEAMGSMGQVMAEGMQTMMKRQGEMMHSGANQVMHLVKEISASPEMGMQKSASFVKHGLENASSNAREMMDVAMKSGMEVFDMMSKKISENMECASPCMAKKKA
jgi:phasin family protein